MVRRPFLLMPFITIFILLSLGRAQDPSDWRKHYGSPVSERYLIRDGITLTVFYSEEGRTCKALVEPIKREPLPNIEEILNEIIPLAERGKKTGSLGLTSGPSGIAYKDYEHVQIDLASVEAAASDGASAVKVISATIDWKGVQCRLLPEQNK